MLFLYDKVLTVSQLLMIQFKFNSKSLLTINRLQLIYPWYIHNIIIITWRPDTLRYIWPLPICIYKEKTWIFEAQKEDNTF